jgi:hypothetical protein
VIEAIPTPICIASRAFDLTKATGDGYLGANKAMVMKKLTTNCSSYNYVSHPCVTTFQYISLVLAIRSWENTSLTRCIHQRAYLADITPF